MASCFDTHLTFSAPTDRSASSAPALGAGAVVMSGSETVRVHRTRGGLNAGDPHALVVRCART